MSFGADLFAEFEAGLNYIQVKWKGKLIALL
jgi:hypothetical protein